MAEIADKLPFQRFSKKALVTAASLLIIYCLCIWNFIGFRNDHILLIALSLAAYFYHAASRRFVAAFFIFIIYWIAYDSMRIFPNYMFNEVHIQQPYNFEKKLFNVHEQNTALSLNEYFNRHHHAVLDVVAGVFYLSWIPVPLAFAFYLLTKDKIYFLRFSYAFVLTNFIGFIIYYLYPAAPPWYVDQYGFDLNILTPAGTAGLKRFDEFFNTPVFHSIYSKNANIFAAIPSLHAAYPVIVLYYGLKRRMGFANIFFFIFLAGIWFAAVYSGHHYVIDLLAGAACAAFSIFIFEYIFAMPKMNNWFLNLAKRI